MLGEPIGGEPPAGILLDVLVRLARANVLAGATSKRIADGLGMNVSTAHKGVRRLVEAGLVDAWRRVNRHAFLDFVEHGLHYVFPARVEEMQYIPLSIKTFVAECTATLLSDPDVEELDDAVRGPSGLAARILLANSLLRRADYGHACDPTPLDDRRRSCSHKRGARVAPVRVHCRRASGDTSARPHPPDCDDGSLDRARGVSRPRAHRPGGHVAVGPAVEARHNHAARCLRDPR